METLLFIDDEQAFLEVLNKYFSSKGYRVLVAPSGAAGLQIAEKEKPDLIVLDFRMPEMDGVQTLKKLRSKDKKTPVIFLSAFGTLELVRESKKLKITDFIGKPFDLNHLSAVIEDHMTVLRKKANSKGATPPQREALS